MYWEMHWITVTEFNVTPNVLSNNSKYWEMNWITVTEFTVTPKVLRENYAKLEKNVFAPWSEKKQQIS